MSLTPLTGSHIDTLSARLPPDTISEVPDAYRTEPRGLHQSTAAALARPRSTDEVAKIVAYANQAGIAIIPYAGGTGLVGGQIPDDRLPPSLLLSVERLNRLRDVDIQDRLVIAEAGVILADLQAAAEEHGLLFPLSLASEGSARLGGNLATNAGGVQVLRYGNTRDLCLGIEAVLADGTVFNGLRRLRKDNTGYDLRHLMIGSEGTLGVITAASLKLFPRPAERVVAFAAVPDPRAGISLLRTLQDRLGEVITAFELIHKVSFEFLAEALPDIPTPFDQPPQWSVLIDIGGAEGAGLKDRSQDILAVALEREMITDAVIAQNQAQATAFWHVRESIPEANRLIGSISSHDISVPVSRIPAFIEAGHAAIAALDPTLRVNCFGHVGDGNLHYNVFPPKGRSRDDYRPLRATIKDCVLELVDSFAGSISAEHGIGRSKARDLERFGDPAKLIAMRAIKTALDPAGILNPGAILRAADKG